MKTENVVHLYCIKITLNGKTITSFKAAIIIRKLRLLNSPTIIILITIIIDKKYIFLVNKYNVFSTFYLICIYIPLELSDFN